MSKRQHVQVGFFFWTKMQEKRTRSIPTVQQTACRNDANYAIFIFSVLTGTSLQLRLIWGVFSNTNGISLFLMIVPRMSVQCKLVPAQYMGYYNVLLHARGIHSPPTKARTASADLCLFLTSPMTRKHVPEPGFYIR